MASEIMRRGDAEAGGVMTDYERLIDELTQAANAWGEHETEARIMGAAPNPAVAHDVTRARQQLHAWCKRHAQEAA